MGAALPGEASGAGPAGAWDDEADLLVFGSGAGGLAAALFGARAGMKVLVCEKRRWLGGTTATSGGGIWIPGTPGGLAAGDSIDKARRYLQQRLGRYYRADLVDAFLAAGPQVLELLERETEVRFEISSWPDYHSEEPGGADRGRTLFPLPFDGKRLGADFALLQPPMHRLMVLGGLMLGANEVEDFLRPWASWGAFSRVTAKVARYALDRLRWSRGTDLRLGNALVARLMASLPRDQVTYWTQSPLVELVVQAGAVVGAVVRHKGRTRRVRARRGVVLATGGFPHSAEMRRTYGETTPHDHSLACEGNVGEGIAAALSAGAAVDTELSSVGNWTPASLTKERDGREVPVIYGYLDRGRPGVIAVNPQGKRFVNESFSYHDIVTAMFATSGGRPEGFHFVCDHAFVRRHGLGRMRPWPWTRSLAPFIREGYVAAADTLPALAAKIGVPADTLVETVRRHNEYSRTGTDLEFGRGATAYNRMFGVKSEWPNPNLRPIEAPPYLALRIRPATIGTTIGLKSNASAQVLGDDGAPIRGLYACGNDQAAVFRGFYPGGGTTLGPALVFAYLAVQSIAASDAIAGQESLALPRR